MKNKEKLILSFLIIFFGYCSVVAGGGGGGGKNGKSGGGGSDPCDNITHQTIILTLTNSFSTAPNRAVLYPPPVTPNPWNGDQGEIVLLSCMEGYYCEIFLTSPDCANYQEEYVWTDYDNTMQIDVPSNISYRVTVQYYEPCGYYYSGDLRYQTHWKWESGILMSPQNTTTGTFSFISKYICCY